MGVAASGVPGAEAAASGEARGFLHSREWWGVYIASTVLMLICYSAVLRQQLGWLRGEKPRVLQSLHAAIRQLPATVLLLLMALLPLFPVVAWVGLRSFDLFATVLMFAGIAALIFVFFAWPAQIAEKLGPWAALARSIRLTRPQWVQVAFLIVMLLAAVLVFVLLTGILMAVIMNLAGQGAQTGHAGLSFSRWLMAAVLGLPIVYTGAVSVVAYQRSIQMAVATTSPAIT
jgi:hypothetical protein